MTDAIIEAVTRALEVSYGYPPEDRIVRRVLAYVTPLIEEAALKRSHHDLVYVRAAALEEAAKVAEGYSSTLGRVIAVAIRALKVATPPPPDPRA